LADDPPARSQIVILGEFRENIVAVLLKFGFDAEQWQELARALKQHAMDNEITMEERTTFGTRYVIEGLLKATDGTWLNIRSAWFIDNEGDAPRFITAHPLRRRR
jgi:hypothetical protein